jgi:tripartite-type tricarboxylate transporter receptor subunit TctC
VIKRLSKSGTYLALAAAMALVWCDPSFSADPIKVIVPVPPGSSLDLTARVLADQIGSANGSTMIVENRPGADTIIGTEFAAHAVPDGKTLLVAGSGLVINPLLRKTNYDPLTSFEPICQLANLPTVIAVSSKSPYLTLPALFDAARNKPGELTLASIGPASTTHLAFEKLKHEAHVDMIFVPYPGPTPAFDAVLGQHVTAYFGESSFVRAQIKAGNLRALAVAAPQRLDSLRDVPTLAELGFPDIMGELWFGSLAPARTSQETINHLIASYRSALETPQIKAKFADLGVYPSGVCGGGFGRFLQSQIEEYGRIVRESGIKPE